jgi:hypothetical protein
VIRLPPHRPRRSGMGGESLLTAVQLRYDPEIRCKLVAGTPEATENGRRGPIALFSSRQVVAYTIEAGSSVRLFLFRTTPRSDQTAAKVAGVVPSVELLLDVSGRRRTTRVVRVLRSLHRWGIPLERLAPPFWARLASLAAARSLLRQSLTGELLVREGLRPKVGPARRVRPPR